MIFPAPYIEFLLHFHGDRDYFECHEVLEEHWKKNGMKRDSIWVGLIQVAVSFYHYRRGNIKGAVKMMDKALLNLKNKREETRRLGINHSLFINKLNISLLNMKTNKPYKAIKLPIKDSELLAVGKELSMRGGFEWGNQDDLDDFDLINRHMTRDRSAVRLERELSLKNKQRELALAIH